MPSNSRREREAGRRLGLAPGSCSESPGNPFLKNSHAQLTPGALGLHIPPGSRNLGCKEVTHEVLVQLHPSSESETPWEPQRASGER